MTRLNSDTVLWVKNNLDTLDSDLRSLIGLGLEDVCGGAGFFEGEVDKDNEIGVIPISAGSGILKHFSETVNHILNYLNFKSEVMGKKDVYGLVKSIEGGKDVVFMADDSKFVAVNLKDLKIVDNDLATARAYSVLTRAVLSKSPKSACLLVGLGRIGKNILEYLFNPPLLIEDLIGEFYIYDIDRGKIEALSKKYPVKILTEDDVEREVKQDIVIDATPSKESICRDKRILGKNTIFIQPGVPPVEEAAGIASSFHDPLALGVGTMAYMVSQEVG